MNMKDQYEVADIVYKIPVREIYVDSFFNCRGFFDPISVQDLASSIRDHGLIEPIVVQPVADMDTHPSDLKPEHKWRLVAGHRREAAVRQFLQWDTIPARVFSGMTKEQAQTLNFLENLDRQDLNMLQEAQAIHRMWPDVTEKSICRRLKKNMVWVYVRVRLIDLSDAIQQAAASKRLTQRDVEFIAREPDYDEQQRLFQGILDVKAKKTRDGPRRKGIAWNSSNRVLRGRDEIGEMMTYIMELGHEHGREKSEIEAVTGALAWTMRGLNTEEFLQRMDLPLEMDRFND
jgi:ParB family chromosome partitioning protein